MPTAAPVVVVVGGAVLDQKLRTRDAPVLGTSNPGVSEAGVGGVGRNIAENLARLGTSTVLVAPVGDDLLHGIPPSLPVDLAVRKVLARVRRRGLELPDADLARLEDVAAEVAEAEARARAALRAVAGSL